MPYPCSPTPAALGDGKRFQQERTLAPRAAGVNLDLLAAQLKAARDRGHDLATEGLQVVRREKPVVLPLMCEDSARDVASVERMAHRREAGHAVVAGRALLIAEELQGPAQIGLDQPLARRRHLAAGHPDCDVLRPLAEHVGVLAHVVEHDRVTGKGRAKRSAPRAPPRRGKVIVPHRSNAWMQASGAAGTTVRRAPSGMVPPWRSMKASASSARGQPPTPAIVTTWPVCASRTIIGATPATLT